MKKNILICIILVGTFSRSTKTLPDDNDEAFAYMRGMFSDELIPTGNVRISSIVTDTTEINCESMVFQGPTIVGTHYHRHPQQDISITHHQDAPVSFIDQFKQQAVSALAHVIIQNSVALAFGYIVKKCTSPQNTKEEQLNNTLAQLELNIRLDQHANVLMARIKNLAEMIPAEEDEQKQFIMKQQLENLKRKLDQLNGPVNLTQEEFEEFQALQA